MISGISFPTKKPDYLKDVKEFEPLVNHTHDVLVIFSSFDTRPFMIKPYFYDKPMEIFKSGKIPMITWYPSTSNVSPTPDNICQQISDGKFDDYIKSVSVELKKFVKESNSKVYLRLGHEMNVYSRSYSKPKQFISMWKYLHSYLKNILGEKIEFIDRKSVV